MNQGLGSRADDTGRAAPRAIPGAEEAEPPNLGCLQRLAKAGDPRPQLVSTTTSQHAPIGPTTPPPGNVVHMSSPERTGGGEGGEGIALCRVFWVKAFFFKVYITATAHKEVKPPAPPWYGLRQAWQPAKCCKHPPLDLWAKQPQPSLAPYARCSQGQPKSTRLATAPPLHASL